MTDEELRKEANEYAKEIENKYIYMDHVRASALGYLAGAKPREKRIEELKEQIEKMKCCLKCDHWYYYKSFCEKDNSYHSEGQSCEYFTLRR